MNFVTRKHMSRRTLLRGAGTAIALPLLDAIAFHNPGTPAEVEAEAASLIAALS